MSGNDPKTTAVQQARVEALQDENGWPRIYTEPVQGKTVIGQFRRYVTREDSSCIEKALYDFLKGRCGFIAEYGLIPPDGGFRTKWAEPADLLAELANGGRGAREGRVASVYADGMTDVEVLAAIDALAEEHRADCEQGRSNRRFNRDVSVAIKLLEPHQFTIVPPGWQLGAPDVIAGQPEPPAGTLAEKLAALAERNGLALLAPPAPVAAGEQITLL